jgi:hypothetical protein
MASGLVTRSRWIDSNTREITENQEPQRGETASSRLPELRRPYRACTYTRLNPGFRPASRPPPWALLSRAFSAPEGAVTGKLTATRVRLPVSGAPKGRNRRAQGGGSRESGIRNPGNRASLTRAL